MDSRTRKRAQSPSQDDAGIANSSKGRKTTHASKHPARISPTSALAPTTQVGDTEIRHGRLQLKLAGEDRRDRWKGWVECADEKSEQKVLKVEVELVWAVPRREEGLQACERDDARMKRPVPACAGEKGAGVVEEPIPACRRGLVVDALRKPQQTFDREDCVIEKSGPKPAERQVAGIPRNPEQDGLAVNDLASVSTKGRAVSQQDTPEVAYGEIIQSDWPYHDPNRPGIRPNGILRKGVECYRRTAMLAVLHLPPFINLVSEHGQSPCDILNCLICALHGVASQVWQPVKALMLQKQTAHLDSVVECLRGIFDSVHSQPDWKRDPRTQGDPGVFLIWMIETMRQQLRPRAASCQKLDGVFGLGTTRHWSCQSCTGRFVKSEAPIVDLITTLSIPATRTGPATLVECFRHRPIGIGRSRHECSECGRRMREYGKVTNAPAVLIFELRRQSSSATIQYPEHLDLAELPKPAPAVRETYLLAAVVCRQNGKTHEQAYHTLYARIANGSIVYIDDASVTGSYVDMMLSPNKGVDVHDEAYLLIYRAVPKADSAHSITSQS